MVEVAVPDFIREAVSQLDSPKQAALLLKILKSHNRLGIYMTAERLSELVKQIKNIDHRETSLAELGILEVSAIDVDSAEILDGTVHKK